MMRVFLVTGATGAIGSGIVRLLSQNPNSKVIILARDETKAKGLIADVLENNPQASLDYRLTDLSSQSSIKSLAGSWEGPLNVLINNAAVAPRRRELSEEGLEMQFAVNILSYVRMIESFRKLLRASEKPRVVNVASYWAGGLDLNDLQFESRRYNNDAAYRQSKQADRMLTSFYAKELATDGIIVNACHPGDVNSRLSNNLGFGGHESSEQGAATPVYLAESPAVSQASGKYYEHLSESPCPFMKDELSCTRLAAICKELSA